jgi:pimeloyl-ACP methyl ester carboxylesterase
LLQTIRVPTDHVYGSLSAIVDAARACRIASCLQHARTPIVIPDAHHHIMLDQPLALVTALQALLA